MQSVPNLLSSHGALLEMSGNQDRVNRILSDDQLLMKEVAKKCPVAM